MGTRAASLRSLAKINLDLRVLHKRADGFHQLRTVFQTISLADQIHVQFEPARRTQISLDDPLAIPDNLVVRAANQVLEALKLRAHVQLSLRKRIPMGGGLGGGSSNAAAVLLALPVLAGKHLPFEKLQEIALSLGSDVPFFLQGGTAVGLGRGEELYPLPDIQPQPVLILSTGLHVSTGPAYAALARGLTFPESSRYINNFGLFVRALVDGRSAGAAIALSVNDFEPVVCRLHPQLKTLTGKLSKVSVGSQMTGSGSAVFAIFDSIESRAQAVKILKRDRMFQDCQVMPATLVTRAGYRRMWREQLAEHLDMGTKLWPPRSRYER